MSGEPLLKSRSGRRRTTASRSGSAQSMLSMPLLVAAVVDATAARRAADGAKYREPLHASRARTATALGTSTTLPRRAPTSPTQATSRKRKRVRHCQPSPLRPLRYQPSLEASRSRWPPWSSWSASGGGTLVKAAASTAASNGARAAQALGAVADDDADIGDPCSAKVRVRRPGHVGPELDAPDGARAWPAAWSATGSRCRPRAPSRCRSARAPAPSARSPTAERSPAVRNRDRRIAIGLTGRHVLCATAISLGRPARSAWPTGSSVRGVGSDGIGARGNE